MIELDAVEAFVAFEHFVHVEVVVAVEPVVQENPCPGPSFPILHLGLSEAFLKPFKNVKIEHLYETDGI